MNGNIVLVHQLREHSSYSVIITTGGGLWRYRLGDVVEVDGFVGATPSLRFMGRGRSVSDLCGEKLAEAFVTRSIATACKALGIAPSFAMLAPEASSGQWHYTLFLDGDVPDELAVCLDRELRANPHYALCRDLGQLRPLECCQIPGNAYEAYCKVSMEGWRLGDIKPRALSSGTDWRKHFGCGTMECVRD
jgi:hypothetical protein